MTTSLEDRGEAGSRGRQVNVVAHYRFNLSFRRSEDNTLLTEPPDQGFVRHGELGPRYGPVGQDIAHHLDCAEVLASEEIGLVGSDVQPALVANGGGDIDRECDPPLDRQVVAGPVR